MARRGRCAPARSTAKSPTAFAANGAPRSTPISDPSSKPHGEDRSEPSTPSASPSSAAPCLAQLENVNGDLSNYHQRAEIVVISCCSPSGALCFTVVLQLVLAFAMLDPSFHWSPHIS